VADIVLGAGKIYFEIEDANGALGTGERYLAETPGFSLSVTPETLEDWSSDGKIAEKLLDITTRVNRGGTLTIKDALIDNIALFVAGGVSTVNQSATPVVDEAVKGWKDKWTQLGASLSNPTGVRNVSSVVITGSGGTPTYSASTDYELDAVMGRFRPLTAGTIADGASLLADYTPAANSRSRIASDQLGPKVGALRFIAENTSGPNKDLYIPKVQMAPDGELAFKSRDTVMQMQFQLRISTRSGYAQVYVDGRAV
jgi:hypothetical protein